MKYVDRVGQRVGTLLEQSRLREWRPCPRSVPGLSGVGGSTWQRPIFRVMRGQEGLTPQPRRQPS
jgi:hypothetical protein